MITLLYKQYHRDVDTPERHTRIERDQQFYFVNLLANSSIIRRLHQFLKCKGMLSVRVTGVVAHWQKLRDCFLKVIVPNRLYSCISVCVVRHEIRDGDQDDGGVWCFKVFCGQQFV